MDRICDKCTDFYQSPGGCVEICQALRTDPTMNRLYSDERINGNKRNCKALRRV